MPYAAEASSTRTQPFGACAALGRFERVGSARPQRADPDVVGGRCRSTPNEAVGRSCARCLQGRCLPSGVGTRSRISTSGSAMSRRHGRLRPIAESHRKEGRREVHRPDPQQPRGVAGLVASRTRRIQRGRRRVPAGAGRVRRVGRRRRRARPPVEREDSARARRRAGDHGRAVRGGQGSSGRLLPARLREHRAGDRDRHARPLGAAVRRRGAAGHAQGRHGSVTGHDDVEDLLRRLAPKVLGVLVRRYGSFDACEDAVQEALLAAALQWPEQGLPEHPRGWLITVASRRIVDRLRSDRARRQREETAAARVPRGELVVPAPGDEQPPAEDDTLTLLFMCAHPALSPASQVALTLRAVGGLSTAEIARAFLVPEATIAQRISRGKQRIKASGIPFGMPPGAERGDRLAAVLHVLYLIFNEGYASTAGPTLQRTELSAEAIRLARMVHRLLPNDGEMTGLLALMLLTDARRPARTGPDGALIPMAEQDRSLWNADYIAEGVAFITEALPRGPIGPYQLQAAIAAIHDEAPSAEATDWPQIMALYELLMRITDILHDLACTRRQAVDLIPVKQRHDGTHDWLPIPRAA